MGTLSCESSTSVPVLVLGASEPIAQPPSYTSASYAPVRPCEAEEQAHHTHAGGQETGGKVAHRSYETWWAIGPGSGKCCGKVGVKGEEKGINPDRSWQRLAV